MSPTRGMTASPSKAQWLCPYCDERKPTLRDVQNHITESTRGDHQGISGESPDEHIIALDPSTGEEIDRYERTEVVRPSDAPLQGVSKRRQIVYAWLANDQTQDPEIITAITDADREYVVRILSQIRRGEISREYWADDLDQALLTAFEDRLDDVEKTMAQQQEITEDDQIEPSGKDIIINAYAILGDNINRKQVWETLSDAGVFDAGYEYFRREYKQAVDGDIAANEIESRTSEQIQSMIKPVLASQGMLADESAATEEASFEEETAGDSADVELDSETVAVDGVVSVGDIQQIRSQVALMHEESVALLDVDASVGARRAEFISEKTLNLLDQVLQNTSSP